MFFISLVSCYLSQSQTIILILILIIFINTTNPSAAFLISPLMLISPVSSLRSNYLSKAGTALDLIDQAKPQDGENIFSVLFRSIGRGMVRGYLLTQVKEVIEVQNKLFIDG